MTFLPRLTATYERALDERPKAFIEKLKNKRFAEIVHATALDYEDGYALRVTCYVSTDRGRFVSGRLELGNPIDWHSGPDFEQRIVCAALFESVINGRWHEAESELRELFEDTFVCGALNANSDETLAEISALDAEAIEKALTRDDLHSLERKSLQWIEYRVGGGYDVSDAESTEAKSWLESILRRSSDAARLPLSTHEKNLL